MCFLLIIVVLIVYLRIVLCDVSAYLYYSNYLLSIYKQSIGNLANVGNYCQQKLLLSQTKVNFANHIYFVDIDRYL